MTKKPTAEQVKAAREAAGLTQSVCAEMFGYGLRSWQAKEDPGAGHRSLTPGEYAYLLLLADRHPIYALAPKHSVKRSR